MGERVTAFVAVGSNIDPEANIRRALRRLGESERIRAVSTFYQTDPIGAEDAPRFVNGVLQLETNRTPRSLKFDVLRSIEAELGRVRTADPNAPREMDLDLILFGNAVMQSPELTLPEPDILKRTFIARPLLELMPDLVLPDTNEPLRSLFTFEKETDMMALTEFSSELKRMI